MITITITIEEKDGSLKTLMSAEHKAATKCEFGMAQIIEKDFQKQQKRIAKKTGGRYVTE